MTAELITALVGGWSCWGPTLAPDGRRVAYLSDRHGVPELWVQDVPQPGGAPVRAEVLHVSDDPVVSVRWSADAEWLACAVAPGGGVRTEVWVIRPDGRDAARVAGGGDQHVKLGPWSHRGHRLVVGIPPATAEEVSRCELIEPVTGEREPVAHGGLVDVIDISAGERYALLRDGLRGAHFCVTLDRLLDNDHPLLPYPQTGSTESGILRPSPADLDSAVLTAYLVTDAGLPRTALVAVELGPEGLRGEAGVIAAREDGELEHVDADETGQLLTLVWNVDGRSELELLETSSGRRSTVAGLPGQVITACVLARDGRTAVVAVDGPCEPQRLWRLDIATSEWLAVTEAPPLPTGLVEPTLEHFEAHDGLPLSGWLYRAPAATAPGPVVLWFHGGPESQERPEFRADHQAVVAAGISVFAPNVRGSSGYGRGFAHADDRYGRWDGITDVRSSAEFLVAAGIADPSRIAVSGRSYGGYLTLASLVRYPHLFAAGIDICGMSDLLTFYRDTEPWIAAAAVTKYGDPEHDRSLLEDLSPLARAGQIRAPLLVIHGEHDTNVPLGEARQIVAAVAGAGGRVDYLEVPDEGHEFRRRRSREAIARRTVDFLTAHLAT